MKVVIGELITVPAGGLSTRRASSLSATGVVGMIVCERLVLTSFRGSLGGNTSSRVRVRLAKSGRSRSERVTPPQRDGANHSSCSPVTLCGHYATVLRGGYR